jgi:ABC-type bacteriocin/lantibiotic exporter with double-glycine peptidase domain
MTVNVVAAGFVNPLRSMISTPVDFQVIDVDLERLNYVLYTPPSKT